MNKIMKASNECIKQIKEFEGCKLEAYLDSGGVPTIGYGHTGNVREGDVISQYYANEYLRQDLAVVELELNRLNVAKTQGQFDALVSFVFNLGIAKLKISTLLRRIKKYNKGDYSYRSIEAEAVRCEFLRWVYCKGKKLNGLVIRRKWEAYQFFK